MSETTTTPPNSVRTLTWLALREQWFNWKSRVALILLFLPVAVAIMHSLNPIPTKDWTSAHWYVRLIQYLHLQFFIWLVPFLFGTAALREEVESGTMSLLLIRPIPRWHLVMAKFRATVILTLPPLVISMWACFLVYRLIDYRLFALVTVVAILGTLFYTAVFQLIGVLFSRPLNVGIIYGVFVETSISTLLDTPIKDYTGLYNLQSLLDPYGPYPAKYLATLPHPLFSVGFLLIGTLTLLVLACYVAGKVEFSTSRQI